MPSSSDYAKRIQEEAQQALASHAAVLQVAFESLRNHLLASLDQLGPKLDAIKGVELLKAERIIADAMQEAAWQNQVEVNLLAEFSGGMRRKETQEEILTLLLDTAYQFAAGVALFVVRGDEMAGWSSRGFSPDTAGRFGSSMFAVADSPLLQRALSVEGMATFSHPPEDARLQEIFQGEPLISWHFLPMKALQRPIALLVACDTGDRRCNLHSLRVVMEFTCLCVENLALKLLQEMRATENAAAEPAAATAPVGAAEPARTAKPEPESSAASARIIEMPERLEPAAAVSAREFAASPAPAAPAAAADIRWRGAEGGFPAEAAVRAPGLAEVVSSTLNPAATPAQKPPAFVPAGAEEEKHHSDAKRFARLLVSEIKLYNEQRLVEARAGGDIYAKLKRDIDRSREMYEKRIVASVAQKVDYFHDEVVRILAENDPAKMGGEYPGPRVES